MLVTPETRLASTIDRAHFAFRSADGAHRAQHATHEIEVAAGRIQITPFHHAGGQVLEGNPLTLTTRAIERGAAVDTAVRGSHVDAATGYLAIDRGAALERLENFDGGLEQQWRFDAEPAGAGDLVVRVAVSGHPYAGVTRSGLHFVTPERLGFRYGHATWVDGDNIPTRVDTRFDAAAGEIVMTVPAQVVADSAYPAVLDPTVSAETAVDSPVIGWTGASARRASIASSGSGFLVVWADGRGDGTTDIFGTRLSSTGAVLDNLGISIGEDAGATLDNAQVAFAAGEYVVVWDDGSNIDAARVTTGGAVTALASVGGGTFPQIAARTGDALVVFQSGSNVSGAVYNGTAFGGAIAIASGTTALPSVGASGSDYLVTWSDGATAPDLLGQLVTPAGGLSGTAITISAGAGGQIESTVSHDGANFFVAWNNNSGGADIYGTRVSAAGAVLDTHMEDTLVVGGVLINGAAGGQTVPAIDCNTGACLVTWSDRRVPATNATDVYAQRLDGNIALVGGEIAVAALSDEQRRPAVVAVGGDYRLAWHDQRHHGTDAVFTARVNGDGSTPEGTGANIVSGNNRETRPTIDGGPNWLVAWSDSRVLGNDIMGVRFSSAGVLADATARTLSGAANQQGNPAMTFDGTNYFLVWNDARNGVSRDVFGARVNTSGTVLDAGGIGVSTAANDQENPSVAAGVGSSLVVWQDNRNGNLDVFGAIVSNAGTVTTGDIAICTGAGAQQLPTVAYDAANDSYLVTWQSGSAGSEDVSGTLVSGAGVVGTPCGAAINAGAGAQGPPKVTFGGGQFFVVWPDAGDINGARVTATGGTMTVVDTTPIGVATGAANASEPDVAFVTPNIFVVAWTDDRNAGVSGTDIWGQVVLSAGILDFGNFVISDNPEDETTVAIATPGALKPAMVAYERARPDLDSIRVGARQLTFSGGTGQACTLDSQCGTGFCVDKRCCDTACGGTDLTDCQACSVARGGSVDGICSIITDTDHVCRGYADTFCDKREKCDGTNIACPDDLGRREGVNCTTSGGTPGVCPANDVTGAPHVCQ